MRLHHLDLGGRGKPPLVILHGLLGSSRNWRTAGADLADVFHVRALDLRNHGLSPHASEQSFEGMGADVLEWLDAHAIAESHLLGHSLGGKLAMWLACKAAGRVSSLCVVDIAPRAYPVELRPFEALLRLDLARVQSRRDADELLKDDIPDPGTRQFLLMNLVRSESGALVWQANLPVIAASLPGMRKSSLQPGDRYEGKAIFLAGGLSRFVREDDTTAILEHFPLASLEILPGTGHFPHVEDRKAFVAAVRRFALGAE